MFTLASYRGMEKSPALLRRAGLAGALGAKADLGDVQLPPLKEDIVEGGIRNLTHFKDATARIYSATKSLETTRVVIIGGECSETVGTTAGLAEAFGGKPGMLWLDAHGDFNTQDTSPSGYIGGMCLAMACGKDPDLSPMLGGKGPPLAEERLVHVGSRALDPPEVAAFNSSPAKLFTSQHVKASGAADVGEEASRHLDNRSDWIVCHLDVDVLDPTFIPAVNYPTPGGLTPDEVAAIIRASQKTGKMMALELAAYDGSRDRQGRSAKEIVRLLANIFR